MVCGLADDELFVLYILYSHRNFRADAGYNSKKLQRIYSKKYDRDFGAGTKRLKNQGYITSIKKKDEKFYISDFKKAVRALSAHDYNVTTGKERPV